MPRRWIPFRGLRDGSMQPARGRAWQPGHPHLAARAPSGRICGSSGLQGRGRARVPSLPSRTAGPERRARASTRTMGARPKPRFRVLRGTRHHRTRASTGRESPVDSAALCFAAPLHDLRHDAGVLEVPTTGRVAYESHASTTLLTLTPAFPPRLDPCGPTLRPDLLSWGCPKIAPPSFRAEESASRATRCRADLRRAAAAPLAHRPRGFSPPRRLPPPRPCRFVAPCSRSWGSPCFTPSRNGDSHSAFLPFEAFPPPTATRRGSCPCPVGDRQGPPLLTRLHRPPCPLALPPRATSKRFPTCSATVSRGHDAEPGPQGLAPSSGPLRRPPLPAACARCSPGLDQSREQARETGMNVKDRSEELSLGPNPQIGREHV